MDSYAVKKLTQMQEKIKSTRSELEQLKGQKIAVVNQLKQLSLTPEEAEKELDSLLKKIEELDETLEDKINDFTEKYPQLLED